MPDVVFATFPATYAGAMHADDANAPVSPAADWKPLLAALANDASRAVFARVALGGVPVVDAEAWPARERRALQSWIRLGVVVEHEGRCAVDPAAFRRALAEGAAPRRTAGPDRFLDQGRVVQMPAGPADRVQLLEWVRDRVFRGDETLTEERVNDRLVVLHDDVAMLRRHLVDAGLAERSADGTRYRAVRS